MNYNGKWYQENCDKSKPSPQKYAYILCYWFYDTVEMLKVFTDINEAEKFKNKLTEKGQQHLCIEKVEKG